ncbi:MAG: glycosyltransferase, partial [Paludibacter sp.]|nr:glycosyltransferase [Paludibacter sp.]
MLITSLAGGGAERVASELSLHLNPNIKRRIVTLTSDISYPADEPPISLNIMFWSPKPVSMLYALIVGVMKYRILLKQNNPDISMSFLVLDNLINIISTSGKQNITTIIQVHTSLTQKFQGSVFSRILKFLVKSAYNRADVIVAVSEGVKHELTYELGIKPGLITVIHNPINIAHINHLAQEDVEDEWFSENIPIIITMGRLTEAKGQWHLIRAFAGIRSKVPCKLVIIGTGELKGYLENLVSKLDLHNEVRFLGWQENPYKYISKSLLFVFPSLWEALPYALIEAMACGTPVVSTDCKYGPREIIGDNEYGILIRPMEERITTRALEPISSSEKELHDRVLLLLSDENI